MRRKPLRPCAKDCVLLASGGDGHLALVGVGDLSDILQAGGQRTDRQLARTVRATGQVWGEYFSLSGNERKNPNLTRKRVCTRLNLILLHGGSLVF